MNRPRDRGAAAPDGIATPGGSLHARRYSGRGISKCLQHGRPDLLTFTSPSATSPDTTQLEVSVVIPAYNAARHIAATVESVLAQEKVALELIVVDDCSTDGTAVYLEAVVARDPRVRYMRMPANSGPPAGPRDFGAHRARAPWIALCDADDLWHPLKLRYQLDLAARTGADLVCCAVEDVQDGKVSTLLDRKLPAAIKAKPLRYWQMITRIELLPRACFVVDMISATTAASTPRVSWSRSRTTISGFVFWNDQDSAACVWRTR